MTSPPLAPPVLVPRILHAALVGGALIAAAVLAVLRQTAPPTGAVPGSLLRYVLLGIAVGVVVAFRTLRGRLEPPAGPGDEAAWWRTNLGFALVSWALAETLALVAASFYYLTGDPLALGVAAGGVGLLLFARPGRPVE